MFETLFEPYQYYATEDIILEVIAIFFGLLSVFLAKKNHVVITSYSIHYTKLYEIIASKTSLSE